MKILCLFFSLHFSFPWPLKTFLNICYDIFQTYTNIKTFYKKIFILPTDTLSLIFYFNLSHIYSSLHPYAWSIVYGTWGITDFFLLPCWRFSLTENWQKRTQKKWKVWPPKLRALFHLFYLFLAVLDLCCCMGFCLAIESKSYSLLQFEGFSSLAVFLAAECRL